MASTAVVTLWDKAVSSLTDEDKQSIDFSRTDKTTILADVLHAAELKKQLCLQKRWKYTKSNGHVIILRDLCEKMIKWVDKFKATGDLALQYDPSHASLPWAAVRFLLQLSVNDMQIFGAMAEGLETVTCEITRCHLYEQLYLSRSSSARNDLESLLLRHYAGLLTYLATAMRYYAKSTLRRLGASFFETSESVDACLSKIAAGRDDVESCARLIDSELLRGIDSTVAQARASVDTLADDLKSLTTAMSISQGVQYQSLKAILASFDQPILRTAAQTFDIHARLKRTEKLEILKWLSTVKYREHHRTSISALMPGSGTWLQQKPEFVDWKTSSTSSILWIHGIPGSGKTILMSTIIQALLDDKSLDTATSAFAYFYCTRGAERARADPDEIMRAALKQLVCFDPSQPIHAAVLREYNKRQKDADVDGSEPSKLSLQDCKQLILEIADQLPIIVIIDALDECDPLRRPELLQALRDIVQKSISLVKVMVSSRNDSDIVCRLSSVPNVYISSDDNGEDVDRFVKHELDKAIDEQRLLQGRVSASLRQRILENLRSRAHGMFLWARLQIQNLCDPERMIVVSDVEDALHQLPATLFELYSGILGRIDRIAPHGRLLAMKTLRWLLCAREPLQQSTLVEMLQSSGSEDPLHVQDVLGLCCNLVVLDDSLDLFRFAHASVREYLESQPRFSLQNTNSQAAQECFRQVASNSKTSSLVNFTRYAHHFWLDHYRAVDYQSRIAQPLANEVKSFFIQGMQGDDAFNRWARDKRLIKFRGAFVRSPEFLKSQLGPQPPMHLACTYGLLEVVQTMFGSLGIHVDSTDSMGATCLYLAACHSYLGLVEALLMRGADPNILTIFHEAALHRAAESGHEAIALLLLQKNAEITIEDDQGRTALDWAVKGNHEAMVRLLILNGSRSEATQKYGKRLLACAEAKKSLRAQEDVLSILHRATGCVGIKDAGHIDYLSALLHFLYSIVPFHHLLRQATTVEDQKSATNASNRLFTEMANALNRLFTEMETSVEIVSTGDLTVALDLKSKLLQILVYSRDKTSAETWAEGEFSIILSHLIDIFKGDWVQERFGDSLHVAYRDLFASELANLRFSRSETAFWIPVDAFGNESFEQALEQFWKDDDKDSPRHGLIRSKLSYSPPVMVFQLQRYQDNRQTHLAERVHSRCTYPAKLVIELTGSQKIPYVLHGVIVHRGDVTTAGKIFIYLKSHHTGRWIRCQNELVTWATEEQVFEGNFGSDTRPERLVTSCTATGLIYIQEDQIGKIARVMVPYSEP